MTLGQFCEIYYLEDCEQGLGMLGFEVGMTGAELTVLTLEDWIAAGLPLLKRRRVLDAVDKYWTNVSYPNYTSYKS